MLLSLMVILTDSHLSVQSLASSPGGLAVSKLPCNLPHELLRPESASGIRNDGACVSIVNKYLEKLLELDVCMCNYFFSCG